MISESSRPWQIDRLAEAAGAVEIELSQRGQVGDTAHAEGKRSAGEVESGGSAQPAGRHAVAAETPVWPYFTVLKILPNKGLALQHQSRYQVF